MKSKKPLKLGRLLACMACAFLFHAAQAQEKKEEQAISIKITADRPDAIYRKGEKVKFSISLLDESQKPLAGKKLSISIAKEAAEPENVSIVSKAEPVEIESSMDRPGFILCTGTFKYAPGKKAVGHGAAGFDPLEIKPSSPPPADFKEFWQLQKAELAKVPMNPVMAPVEQKGGLKDKVETFDVKIDCAGGAQVSGYYSRPVKAAPKSLPAFLCLEGAGVRSASRWMEWRASKGMIVMDINAHGIENGKPKEYYEELANGRLKAYATDSFDERGKCYFRGMFLRVLRGLEFLKAQPEWDGRTLIIWGGSQGGAQALAGAALDPQVSFCVALIPAMCNHLGPLAGLKGAWPNYLKFSAGSFSNPEVAKTAPYYDLANFAPEIKAETFVGVGLVDTTCPPSGVYAAYNMLNSKKEIVNYPSMGHVYNDKDASARLQDYLERIAKAKN